MGRTQEDTPFYIRTDKGETFNVETLDEAVEELVSEDGYRLTISTPAGDLVIRRGDFNAHAALPDESEAAWCTLRWKPNKGGS